MARWSCAGGCCTTRMTPRTPSRPPFWCWPAKPPRSGSKNPWQVVPLIQKRLATIPAADANSSRGGNPGQGGAGTTLGKGRQGGPGSDNPARWSWEMGSKPMIWEHMRETVLCVNFDQVNLPIPSRLIGLPTLTCSTRRRISGPPPPGQTSSPKSSSFRGSMGCRPSSIECFTIK